MKAYNKDSVRRGPKFWDDSLFEESGTLKVAIVDDEIADTFSAVIKSLGYPAPSLFISGTSLVSAIMMDHANFDVVLMDYRLPEMNGIEAAKIVQKYSKDTLIIMTSGYDFVRDEANQIGIPYLQKPFTRAQLAKVLAAKTSGSSQLCPVKQQPIEN